MSTLLFDDVFRQVREASGFRALALVRLDGRIEAVEVSDPEFDSEVLAEFATLLRIAYSTSEDTPEGGLSEMSWKSNRSTVLMSRVTADRFLVFFGTGATETGRVRYRLRREARRLSLKLEDPAPSRPTL